MAAGTVYSVWVETVLDTAPRPQARVSNTVMVALETQGSPPVLFVAGLDWPQTLELQWLPARAVPGMPTPFYHQLVLNRVYFSPLLNASCSAMTLDVAKLGDTFRHWPGDQQPLYVDRRRKKERKKDKMKE